MMGLKYHICLICLLSGSIFGWGQQVSHLEITLSPDQFEVVPDADQLFKIEAEDASFFYPETTGAPSLPIKHIAVLVPESAELVDYSYDSRSEVFHQSISLSKLPAQVPFNQLAAFNEDEDKMFRGSHLPVELKYLSTRKIRGFTWFSFQLSPFKYNGERKELSLITRLNLSFKYVLDEKGNQGKHSKQDIRGFVEGLVENPWDMEQFYPIQQQVSLKSTSEKTDYLIVTSEALESEFDPLIEWKNRKGLKAKTITVEEIYSTYEGQTEQMKIKQCLFDFYQNQNLKWVLLGGDETVVPVQGCFGMVNFGGSELVDESIPTDLFYACFDQRFDWNSNKDLRVGEPYVDGHDIVPDIYLARFPANQPGHVRSFIKKTLAYELNPPVKNFAERILLSGVKSWNVWNGRSDNHHRNELMFYKYISPGWPGKKVGFYDTGTDFESGEDFQVISENLIEKLNDGYGVFHYAGHGNVESYMMEYGAPFNTIDASKLINDNAGLMLSTTCDVNAFDSTSACLSEAFLRNPDGGCVAFYGSSRLGFGLIDQSSLLGSSFQYNAKFLEFLYADDTDLHGNSFGKVAALSKSSLMNNGASGGVYQYLQYALNPMGDPELPIYTRDPKRFDRVRIYSTGNALIVNTGGIEGCRICMTSLDLNQGFFETVEDVDFYTFETYPEQFQLTITKPNHIPYIYTSSSITGIDQDPSSLIRIYPNPVLHQVLVDMHVHEGQAQVFDLHGKMLSDKVMHEGINVLPAGDWASGVYLLKISTPLGNTHHKILKK